MKPVRLLLSRRKGFDLQAMSLARNGLPAQSVVRPGRWGNPFVIAEIAKSEGLSRVAAHRLAIARFAAWMDGSLPPELSPGKPYDVIEIHTHLAGKNLACWCPIGGPCHAEILIDLANKS